MTEYAVSVRRPERADEMLATLVSLIPFATDETFRVVELGSGDGELSEHILNTFPQATLMACEGSQLERERSRTRLGPFGSRAQVRKFDIAALDWWDIMFGADLVVSALRLHQLNDAKQQYLYKAVADRLSPRGAFLIADSVEPALLHHLIWLKHAGFSVVDCFWLFSRHAVFGGFKQTPATPGPTSAQRPPAGS